MLIPRNSGLVAILELEGNPADVIDGFDRAEDMDDPLRLLSGKDTAGKSWAGGLITTAGGLRRFRRARHGRRHERRDGTECGD